MNRSEQTNELMAAFAKAQAALPAVPKRGRGQVGQQRTQYATLDDVINTAREPLAANGLSFAQLLDGDASGPTLTTTLMHESGQWMAASTPLEAMDGNRGTNAMQAFGSTLTYLKRYALAAMLGVTTDEDDDGHASSSAPQRRQVQREAAPAPAPSSGKHWIKNEGARKSFWAWTSGKGLNGDQVHDALGVDHVEEYRGSKAQAAAAIEAHLKQRPFTE